MEQSYHLGAFISSRRRRLMTGGKKSSSPEAMHRSDPPSDRASEPLRPSQNFFLPSVLLSPFSSRPSFSVLFPPVRPTQSFCLPSVLLSPFSSRPSFFSLSCPTVQRSVCPLNVTAIICPHRLITVHSSICPCDLSIRSNLFNLCPLSPYHKIHLSIINVISPPSILAPLPRAVGFPGPRPFFIQKSFAKMISTFLSRLPRFCRGTFSLFIFEG